MSDQITQLAPGSGRIAPGPAIKLVIWDLDGTLWKGILLEGDALELAEGVADTIRRLDARGILHSICSRNDHATALQKLGEFQLEEYFLCPRIGWGVKSSAVRDIAETLRLGLDSVLVVDDDAFERAEISAALPGVRTVAAEFASGLLEEPALTPAAVTEEARRRRRSYQDEVARERYEREFEGASEAFLWTLGLRLRIMPTREEDLHRAEELVLRTNQLNSTGIIYPFAELERLRGRHDHQVFMASLSDRFGDYGQIGLVLLHTAPSAWHLKLLLVSCRVLSRGVGAVLLNHLLARAKRAGVRLTADFRSTTRNRPMQLAYRFANFRELRREGDIVVYYHDLERIPKVPGYFRILDEPMW